MKFSEINSIFTQKVKEYLDMGYTINTTTMSGLQGEVAKVDLTNGKEIIRIRMESHYRLGRETLHIIVGKCTDKVKPNGSFHDIVWNQNLKELEETVFYKVGNKGNFYGTEEEAQAARDKHLMRRDARGWGYSEDENNTVWFDESYTDIVLPIIRRSKGMKTVKRSDVRVFKRTDYNFGKRCVRYGATARGRYFYFC